MSALPPKEMRNLREAARAAAQPVEAMQERWIVLHQDAAELSRLAQLAPAASMSASAFAKQLDQAEGWRRALVWQGVEDMNAIMAPGLAALRVLTARGQQTTAPALALWCEFHAARESVLAVLIQPQAAETALASG